MKNSIIAQLFFTTLLLSAFTVFSQETDADAIHKYDGEIIYARVTEMNTTEVKYIYPDRPTIVLAIDNELVDYIILVSGEKVMPTNNDKEINDLAYESQKKMIAKLGLFTPLQGYLDLGFEYSHKPLYSIEGTLGVIGLGTNDLVGLDNDKGVTFSAGYKVYAEPDFHLRKLRNAHRMSGLYLKPTLALAYFTNESETRFYNGQNGDEISKIGTTQVFHGAVLLQFGKQRIFGEVLSTDFNLGLGYGFKEINDKNRNAPAGYEAIGFYNFPQRNYGFTSFSGQSIALSASFKMGFLIK